jgi:hypothetical protein
MPRILNRRCGDRIGGGDAPALARASRAHHATKHSEIAVSAERREDPGQAILRTGGRTGDRSGADRRERR